MKIAFFDHAAGTNAGRNLLSRYAFTMEGRTFTFHPEQCVALICARERITAMARTIGYYLASALASAYALAMVGTYWPI